MSHQITVTYTRPNLDTPFYNQTAEYYAWFNTNYKNTGKVTLGPTVYSDDGLTMQWVAQWVDDAAMTEFNSSSEAQAAFARRTAYMIENNMSVTVSVTE